MKKVAVLTGAGISAESGIKTFRDGDGLWEGYDVTQVATPEAWETDPKLVQRFYNERRGSVRKAQPNPGHKALVDLEEHFSVTVITQNIDDLHERAGSSNVLHLHGEILKSQSSENPFLVYDIEGDEINMGELCELGSQLRPHVVWFGEAVPMLENASEVVRDADILIVAGTSLVVYPAAGLLHDCRESTPIFLIDPAPPAHVARQYSENKLTIEKAPASAGVPRVVQHLIENYS